jgi:hypothetical protein
MQNNFPWSQFKPIGIFNGLKFNDYEGQAARICTFFGLKEVFEYSKIGEGCRCHLSYDINWEKLDILPANIKFVETIETLNPIIGGKMPLAKVVSIVKKPGEQTELF